jgi:hypothetical protein
VQRIDFAAPNRVLQQMPLSALNLCRASPVVTDFTITFGRRKATFCLGIDFCEGENRLCWTLAGLDKLIGVGLWKREFDRRGNLISKPMTVEMAMKLLTTAPES